MKRSTMLMLALAFMSAAIPTAQAQRTVKTTITTQEITSPAVVASPDGRTLIVTALGHLFELPMQGGKTTQLTFGAAYDSDPAISPDGKRIAFTSNRDASGSNIFILDRATRRVTQLSHGVEATRAAWSPDGKTVAYAETVAREDHPKELVPGFADTSLRVVHEIDVATGTAVPVGDVRAVETLFYLPDGRLGWSVRELGAGGMMGPRASATRLEVREKNGSVTVLTSSRGDLGRVALSPKGDSVYYVGGGAVQQLALKQDAIPVAGVAVKANGGRVAATADGTLYFGDVGKLWRATSGAAQPIAFSAEIQIEARPQVKSVARFSTAKHAELRAALAPTLSPDGKQVIVMAGGFLWQQPVSGGAATKLFERKAFIRNPAYSPDGSKLAYAASENGKRTLEVYDFASEQTKVLFTGGGAEWPLFPSWSPDGQRIVFQHSRMLGMPQPVIVVNVSDGVQKEVAQAVGSWQARPGFSVDGQRVYFTSRVDKIAALYSVGLEAGAKPVALTAFSRHVHEAQVSPDGKWFAQRRNSEVWLAPMNGEVLKDAQLRRVSALGGRSFAFTPDSTAIVYSADGKLYRQPLAEGARVVALPTRLDVQLERPAPLLVSNVRVLDFKAGRFSDAQSIYVEDGRIRWIGNEQGKRLPADVVRVDGKGRFAIPGLFDAHVHSAWFDQQTNEDAFIAFGVTSVRDVGSALDLMTALDDRSNFSTLAAPRYFYSGEIMEGAMPLWGDVFYTIGNEQETRAEVRNLKAAGADFVKIYPSLPWKLQDVVSDEAHKIGLPIVGHGLSLEEITRRVVWGSTSVEHSQAVTNVYEDVHKMLAATHTAADLTLAVGGSDLMRVSDPGWEEKWRVQEYVPTQARQQRGGMGGGQGNQPTTREGLLERHKGRLDSIAKAHDREVPMPTGTDSLMGGVYFGLSLHWELAQFVDAGVPAIDALRSSTQGGADLVGASKDLGSLEAGKLADIVLLDSDPLANIRNTQDIWQVIKGGRLYDPAKLRPGTQATAAK